MVTWANVPAEDGRCLALGWMSNWQYAQVVPTKKWRSAMTLPRELTLHKDKGDYHLRSLPVAELDKLVQRTIPLRGGTFKGGSQSVLGGKDQNLYKLNFSFERPASARFSIRLSNSKNEYVDIGYDGVSSSYFIDRRQAGKADFSDKFAGRHTAPVNYDSETVDLCIFLDHAAVELFADDGRTVMTDIMFPSEPLWDISIVVEKGEANLISSSASILHDIW